MLTRLKTERSWPDYFTKRDHYLRLGWELLVVEQRISSSQQPWVCPDCGQWVSYLWLDRHTESHLNFQRLTSV